MRYRINDDEAFETYGGYVIRSGNARWILRGTVISLSMNGQGSFLEDHGHYNEAMQIY